MVVVTSPSVIRAMVGLASVLYRAASWTYDNCSRWNARRQRNTGDVVLVPPPYILYTPCCAGCTEESKAKDLTEKLGVDVRRSMVVLSHSSMRTLAPRYSGKRVMVLGSSAKRIAEEDLGLSETVRRASCGVGVGVGVGFGFGVGVRGVGG